MLISTVVASAETPNKAEFLTRFAHCAALLVKLRDHDMQTMPWHGACHYHLTGHSEEWAPAKLCLDALGMTSFAELGGLFESADRYTTIEEDVLDERRPLKNNIYPGEYPAKFLECPGHDLLLLNYVVDQRRILEEGGLSEQLQLYAGTKNHPPYWSRYCEQVVENPAFNGFNETRDGYIRFLKTHCKSFVLPLPDFSSHDPPKIRTPTPFSIEELLRFPIPIY